MLKQYEKERYLGEGFMEVLNFFCEYVDNHPGCTWEDVTDALEARFPGLSKRYRAKYSG